MPVFLLLVFLLCSFSPPASSNDGEEIYIVTENYPPYEMEKPFQNLQGFDYEVVSEVFSLLGFKPKITFLPWKRALREARLGKTVGIMTCAYTKEREEFIIFSDPISKFTNGFFVRKDFGGPKPLSLEDVRGLKTGSVKAYESLQALKDIGLNPVEANTSDTALSMLIASRFDYLYINGEKTKFDLMQQGLVGKVDFHPIITKNFHFCFSKSYPNIVDIAEKFNAALGLIKYNGTYERIHSKYR